MVYDRLTAAWRAFFDETFPLEQFKGNFQYTIRSCDYAAQTADLDPVSPDLGLPSLVKIPIRSPLLAVKLVAGDVCLVGFENYSPAFPYVAGLPSAGPDAIPIVRQGDVCWVQCTLAQAYSYPAGTGGGPAPVVNPPVPIPGVYNIVVAEPPPPPFIPGPGGGGPFKVYGIASSGSQFVKSK